MKVVALKKSAAEKKSDKESGSMPYGGIDGEEGISVPLEHGHLEKMGVNGELTPGHKVKFRGHGHVKMAEKDGHARLMLTHAGMEHGEPDADDKNSERKGRRSDIERAYSESESKRK
jgi:hypothetical protein